MEILSCCFTPPPSDAEYKCKKKKKIQPQTRLCIFFSPLLLESGNNAKDERTAECQSHGEQVCFYQLGQGSALFRGCCCTRLGCIPDKTGLYTAVRYLTSFGRDEAHRVPVSPFSSAASCVLQISISQEQLRGKSQGRTHPHCFTPSTSTQS